MELRRTLADVDEDVVIAFVMPKDQITEKAVRFFDGNDLRGHIRFLSDPASKVIEQLGLRKGNAEAMEAGVPHPTTYVLDRDGLVRFVDVREDYHHWLDSTLLLDALDAAR